MLTPALVTSEGLSVRSTVRSTMRLIVKRIALLFFAISMFSNIEIAQSAKPEVADSTKTEQDIAASWTHPKPPPTGKVLRVHQEFMANIDLYKDDELQTYVQALGERLVEESEDAGKDYYFFFLISVAEYSTMGKS